GMGPTRSRAAAGTLAGEPGRGLLVVGFCGALIADSPPGEVVVAEEVFTADDEGHPSERVRCDGVEELVAALARDGICARCGPIVCVSRLALGKRRTQLREAGAIAVDMESVWLAPGAGERPFAVVRVVLDSPTHELLRPQAAVGAARAARALRAVARSLHVWAQGD
ncbi:MAG: 1-hydroxy-2-methyl-2-butenyl 4-diphosphate reductase, partial [Actinomycetota bacterium]|nr:1-hydroxy-2-methyl-2-butenyl 4-diphosphate reductase [Actinomycetota bacterium]